MNILKRTMLLLFCVFILILQFPSSATAASPNADHAEAVLLYCVNNGIVIYEKNGDVTYPCDNMAKMMTAFVACEKLADRLEETVTVSADMLSGAKNNKMGIVVDEVMPIKDLVYGLILCGYSDCATALAVLISEDQNEFVSLMNSRASKLGMNNTLYNNPTGYSASSSSSMYTTAEDCAKLALAASQNELYLKISSTPKFKVGKTNKSPEVSIYNRNYMVSSYRESKYYNSDCKGIFAVDMGKNKHGLATLSVKDDASYICIVLNADVTSDSVYSYITANDILKWAYKEFGYIDVVSKDKEVCSLDVTMSDVIKKVGICAESDVKMFMPVSDKENVKISYRLNYKSLEAPITKGEQVGYITVTYGSQTSTVKLITAADVEGSEFLYTMGKITKISQSRVFKASIASAIVLTIIAVVIDFYIKRRKEGYNYIKYPRKRR